MIWRSKKANDKNIFPIFGRKLVFNLYILLQLFYYNIYFIATELILYPDYQRLNKNIYFNDLKEIITNNLGL